MVPTAISVPSRPTGIPEQLSPTSLGHTRHHSTLLDDDEIPKNGSLYHHHHTTYGSVYPTEVSHLSSVVHTLKRRSSQELGSGTSARLLNATHDSILDWIRAQRMSYLPPEGSSYDKVLAWAHLFVERLHSFDMAIGGFASDSYLAAQLAYGYCAILLELGRENAPALMISFGFFYSMSQPLSNLLERAELFSVSHEIKGELMSAMSDLVTLVANVSTHFHKAIHGLTNQYLSINIYSNFPGEIKSFTNRCEKTAESMWKYQLMKEGIDASAVSQVQSVISWISPEDPSVASVVNTTCQLTQAREELTCLWVGHHLTRFLKSPQTTLSISGKPGSGKSILASVIVDYLQHPIGGVSYHTIFVPINSRIPAEATPRAVAKTLLSQLFHKRIGNVALLKILVDAYERSIKATNDSVHDDIVWSALESAFSATLHGAKELVVVVDGIDEVSCNSEAELLRKLTKAAARGTDVKLITLGDKRPQSTTAQSHISMTEDMIFDDIAKVARSHLSSSNVFLSLSDLEQETLVTQITTASAGSFLWASLAAKQVIHGQSNKDGLSKTVDRLVNSGSTIHDFVLRTLQSPNVTEMSKLMLLWIATAERPLSLKELSILASIQVNNSRILNQHLDTRAILEPVNSLVFLQDGSAYLRHGLIRQAILDMFRKGKLSVAINDCETDLASRLLLYIKMNVNQPHEPSLTALDSHETSLLLSKYPLLDFAIRYWPVHLGRTPGFVTEGDACATKLVGNYFPNSTTALLLQSALWERRPTSTKIAWHTTVSNICHHLWTPQSVVTLQSLVSLGLLCRHADYKDKAVPLLYEATTMANTLLNTHHPLTMQMATSFLDITPPDPASIDVMAKREKTLRILMDCYKVQHGEDSDNVVTTLKMLLDHYRLVKEEPKAQQIIKTIHSIEINRTHERESDLNVHLKGRDEKKPTSPGIVLLLDTEEHDELIHKSGSFDFELSINKAKKCAVDGSHDVAECMFIEMWQRVAADCRTQPSGLWEERKIRLLIEYSKFLLSLDRQHDASSVLATYWEEFKQTNLTVTEKTVPLLHEIAKVMKSTRLFYESVSVLKICLKFYQSNNRTETSTCKEIEQGIHTISNEIMQLAVSTKIQTSESVLEEMVLEASRTITTMDQTTFTATHSLIKLMVSQRRWQEATRLTKKILRGTWPSLFSPHVQDVMAPANYLQSCLELAECLCECYHSRRRLSKEEDIRMRIYRALRCNRDVDDRLREQATSALLDFYARTRRNEMVINIRQEILSDYTNQFGPDHPRVITMLWELARLTHPRPISFEYYQRIIRTLNNGLHITCADTFEPVLIVATEMWSKGLYPDALPYYKMLFSTFLEHPDTNSKFRDPAFVKELFSRCIDCLRGIRSEFMVLHKITTEYLSQCKNIFGPKAPISIQATLSLAMLSLDSERYEPEAITLFEDLLKIESEEIDHQEISTILDSICQGHIYAVSILEPDVVRIERTVNMLRQRVTKLRQTSGWANVESLAKVTELVKFYHKHQETELLVIELQETTVNVLASETSPTRLISAAESIASNFITTNQVGKAMDLVDLIYRQIIMKATIELTPSAVDLSFRGRESLVFLAHLDHNLRHDSTPVTEILGTLMIQYVYFEQFRNLIKHNTATFYDVCEAGSRLHHSLVVSERHSIATRFVEELVDVFLRTEGQRMQLIDRKQITIFLSTLLQHFSTHKSKSLARSIGISGNEKIVQLLKVQKYENARDLALACFAYISSDKDMYRTPEIAKLVLIMGMNLGDRNLAPEQDGATRKKMLEAAGTILKDVLKVLSEMNISLEQVSLRHLNSLIGLLGEHRDHQTLSWLLKLLWNSRDAQRNWDPSTTFALARRFIMVRYLVGDTADALSLAEDMVYNYRRVYGSCHASTLEMSVLLTQLYTGIAQRYQKLAAGQAMANRYYKKSATIHENILRAFSDPSYAGVDSGLESRRCSTVGPTSNGIIGQHGGMARPLHGGVGDQLNGGVARPLDAPPQFPGGAATSMSDARRVRQHMQYLKLALERLGGWPKDYGEYESLSADLFRVFGSELHDVGGMERWVLNTYGLGKAESNEDILDSDFKNWELVC